MTPAPNSSWPATLWPGWSKPPAFTHRALTGSLVSALRPFGWAIQPQDRHLRCGGLPAPLLI